MKKDGLLETIQQDKEIDYHAKEWELFKEKTFLEQFSDKEEEECQK